jgi:hypothetical protein
MEDLKTGASGNVGLESLSRRALGCIVQQLMEGVNKLNCYFLYFRKHIHGIYIFACILRLLLPIKKKK